MAKNILSKYIRGKKGSTLLELSIVIAMLAIISTMIISFTVLVSEYVRTGQSQYNFTENVSDVRHELSEWLSETDTADTVFSFSGQSILAQDTVKNIQTSVEFSPDTQKIVFTYKDGKTKELSAKNIDILEFARFVGETPGATALVKCTITTTGEEETYTQSFVFTLRCAATAS